MPATVIATGSHVTVTDVARNCDQSFRLVEGSGDPRRGVISSESPVGRALAGHHVGDTVSVSTPGGARELRIVALA